MQSPASLADGTVGLRPLDEADLAFVHAGVNHPEVRPHLGQQRPSSLAEERRHLEALLARDDALALLVLDGDEPAGVVELDPIDREHGVADLAAWVHPDRQGRGVARAAVGLVVGYAFEELRMHKVTAEAYATNAASCALFDGLGFVREGLGREDAFLAGAYRDTVYFGVLETEWAPSRDGERSRLGADPRAQ